MQYFARHDGDPKPIPQFNLLPRLQQKAALLVNWTTAIFSAAAKWNEMVEVRVKLPNVTALVGTF